MKKRILTTILALVCVMVVMAGCGSRPLVSNEFGVIDLYNKGIINERLKEMVESGEIPEDATALTLAANQISDITPLTSLTKLTYLDLCVNEISDVAPLKSLTNLYYLNLNDNKINDITPLESLTSLKILSLHGNLLTQEQIDGLRKALPNCEITWV